MLPVRWSPATRWHAPQALNLDPQAYLTNHDSYTFFSMLGDNLKPGPTHTNVNDLLFMLVLE